MSSTVIDPCPFCGTTAGVRPITGASPKVQAWSCTACETQWAATVVNPHLFLNRLAATVELATARKVLRQVIALADSAPALTDEQLRHRLGRLANGWCKIPGRDS